MHQCIFIHQYFVMLIYKQLYQSCNYIIFPFFTYLQHAHALEHLNIKKGDNILDVGSGSGYLTACMAHMVKYNLLFLLYLLF